ncbi:MAG TPA: tetratricopeptide repeat protein [Bryobacteraceae bacterium]|nr:tetratricopeptide repeat protein [Bryobacteraceae bacterium]
MISAVRTDLINGLREDLGLRRIGSGMARLDGYWATTGRLDPEDPDAAALLCYIAQWVDAGWRDIDVVQDGLAHFPMGRRFHLRLTDYVHVLMAQGMVWVREENIERALSNFGLVLALRADVPDLRVLALAHFWTSRCHRKNGEYDAALTHAAEGHRYATDAGMEPMAAAMRVAESWLLFQKGRTKDALRLLAEAEAVLRETDDYITLGNIQSSYGRMYRREGRYDLALRHFSQAIDEYSKRDPEHRNLARSLANMGYVERLIALQLRKRIDADAAQRRRSEPELRREYEGMRAEALAHLDRATQIYRLHSNHRGAGTVCVNRGHLHLDSGDLYRADEEARQAYALGEEKKDYILMARAKLLECMVENTKLEEEIEDPAWVAHLALEAAREAVELSKRTENRRLTARALIWQGLTICNTSSGSTDSAREICDQAAGLLKNEVQDHIWEDLQTLKAKVVRGGNLDATLQAWSQGVVGERSFQQLTEDFADLIIPKIWDHEGRKVARVAKRLSISPKKVRRVLARLGLHGA